MQIIKDKKDIFSVTIGIPAYNEEANIFYLLSALASQKEDCFAIEKILVVSDGSTDKTTEKVRALKDKRIQLIESSERKGKPARINEIFREAQSEIVVILDADIKLASGDAVKNLIQPLIEGRAAYSSGFAAPFPPETFAQKIAFTGVEIWNSIRKSKYGSPLYFSEGCVRAFKKTLYKEMKFPEASADDVFPFLYCVQKNYSFAAAEELLVYYKLPETFPDYLKQSKRFLKSQGIQELSYDKKFVAKYYTIGFEAKAIYLIRNMIKNPFWTALYLGMVPLTKILCLLDKNNAEAKWEVILSSKKIKTETGKNKIIFSSYDSIGNPYYNGGGASAIHEAAKRLINKYEVKVICGNYPSAKNHSTDGVFYKYIGLSFLRPKLSQLIFPFLLMYYAAVSDFDVWLESFTPPFSISFLAIFTKKPVIGLVHMLAGEDMRRKYKLPFQLVENIGLKKYNNFIVPTKEIKEKIIKINPNAIVEIIPNGADIDLAYVCSDKKHFLFIGRIEINQKGLDVLLKAYGLIAQKTGFPLVIAGAGLKSEEKKLSEMIREAGLADKVHLAGRVDGAQKARIFQEAIATVIPSRFETFSLTALESLVSGIPVISFDIEGLKWLPEEFSYKVKQFDAIEMARAMEEASGQNGNKKINLEKLKIFLKDYDWDTIAEKYKKVIDHALNHKNQNPDINLLVEEIVRKKTPCIFISPHLDDAILSSGGLLLRLASKTQITIATVFTEALLPPYTFSARMNMKMCGDYENAKELFRKRKTEDIEVCKAIGARYIHFGFQDALFRKNNNRSLFSKIIGRFLPEVECIYPTYRFNIISGKISKNDAHTLIMLERKLRQLKRNTGDCAVFCPLGIGNHVDHIIVREICRKVFPKVVFWEDYPYNLKAKKEKDFLPLAGLGSLDILDMQEEKIKMISRYKSQIKSMFPRGIVLAPENYYAVSKNPS